MRRTKKQRKQKKMASQRQANAKRLAPQKSKGNDSAPLVGMVVLKKNIFIPTECDDVPITYARTGGTGEPSSQILFRPQAVRLMKEYIGWGKATEHNTVEQQGILLGKVFKTPRGHFAVVESVLLSEAIGSPVYVESSHSHWFAMERQMDELNETRKHKLVKIGWWHTHPNELDVFMSGTDRNTQRNFFYKDWQFAVVLNPQKKTWGAFVGENAEPCQGIFMNRNILKLKA